ncbi:hypothetical protein H257_10181 [Aphanomyces astaci]|uniref:DDE-1 domain-containing protein n=1 Tax=Aphanomyces astaci TaxID=112090 RepID=W4G812_APHAT|nr:hypothetical protein H257_10181 [Aphanomyces astaci]ETV75815.1 hypothetical protein H257_10181 [Aphanomyces astaci]|eukprot:XP_009834946.1 hypothetical protein H257_10181 [Aphanomyces astaci]
MVAPDRTRIVEWINRTWNALPAATIIQGFRRTKLLYDDLDVPEVEQAEYSDDESVNTFSRAFNMVLS